MHAPDGAARPAISVVLPTYNGARDLAACLSSVAGQTFEAYELLIGDDGSTDETLAIIDRYPDARWRVVRREQNLGLFGNLNALLAMAQAPLIRFLCQDDVLEPTCLAEEVAFFAAHPDAGMFFCKYHLMDETGAVRGQSPIDDLPVEMAPHVSLQYLTYYGCLPGNLSTACVSRRALEQVGLFDESYKVAGDFELWVRICRRFTLAVLHKYLVRLRNHTGQLSRSRASYLAHLLETRRLRAAMLPELPAEVRSAAARYTLMRQNVFDTHYALRCLAEGRRADAAAILAAQGPRDAAVGLAAWLASANNRLFQPKPPFTTEARRLQGPDEIRPRPEHVPEQVQESEPGET